MKITFRSKILQCSNFLILNLKLNQRTVFLFDAVGAFASLILTAVLLPFFSDLTGLPKNILYMLAVFPLIYSIYSLNCYWFAQKIKTPMLLTIIAANLLYCVITGSIVFFYENATPVGRALLILESIVIIIVVLTEIQIYRQFVRPKL